MPSSKPAYSAVVLAADRNPDDPLLEQAGVTSKALIEVAGTPMILRVLGALREGREIGSCLLSGPAWSSVEQLPVLQRMIESNQIRWLAKQATPSASAYAAMQTIDPQAPVLVTTADHPLLSTEIIDYFCQHARDSGLDLAVGLTDYERISKAFPGITKTVLRFSDGNYCGCNLFAFLSPRARQVADYWRRIENQRKKPLRMAGILGWRAILKYLFGRLSLRDGTDGLSKSLQLRIGVVHLPFPEAAIDVDNIGDHQLVQEVIDKRG